MVVALPYCSRKKESVNDSMLKLLFLFLSTSCLLIRSSYSFTSALLKEIDTVIYLRESCYFLALIMHTDANAEEYRSFFISGKDG